MRVLTSYLIVFSRCIVVLTILSVCGFQGLTAVAANFSTAEILGYGANGEFVQAQQASEAFLANLLNNPPTNDYEAQGSYVASTFYYEYLAKAAKIGSNLNSQSSGVIDFFKAASVARRGEMSTALKMMINAIHDAPNIGALTAFLGRLYMERCMSGDSDCDNALAHLRTAIREDPMLPGPHFDAGILLAHLGRYEEASEAYHSGLQLVTGIRAGWAHANLAIIAVQLERVNAARVEARKAEELGVVFPRQFRSIFGLEE